IPALGDFDSDAEVELALMDLREQFPNFAQAKILSIRVMRDDWPAQRSCAGYDLPRETGIAGLWCVGDAVKQYGNGGTQACAETAKLGNGGILALLGSNGAGKSTLLKAMSGILHTEEGVIENGTIRFRDQEVQKLAPDELVRRGIVQVPEGRRVFPALTIDENLQMGGYTKT